MKVCELIEQLKKLDQGTMILVEGYEQGFDNLREIFKTKVFPSLTSRYYNGYYNDISDAEEKDNLFIF